LNGIKRACPSIAPTLSKNTSMRVWLAAFSVAVLVVSVEP
jgi:hypothetical protein